ncbi:MAG TPA: regulatory protein RecX [Acidobacteriaceae bacterium]|jgi:regulatory protein|nr:regulatory protein RecX [Acidobacteriaceae bacterium]
MPFSSSRKPRQPLDEAALYEYAVRALGRKMRTVAELKRLLRTRVEQDDNGEAKMAAVIARLKEQHYLNDTTYASVYTRLRQENEKFGKRRVQQDLMQRGVHSEIIAKTLDTAYEGLPEETQIRRFLERKRIRQPQDDKQAARVLRMLVRAGFSMGTIFPLLKAWRIDDASLETLSEALSETDLDSGE